MRADLPGGRVRPRVSASPQSVAHRSRERLPAAMWAVAAIWLLGSTADGFVVFTLLWLAEPQGWSGVQTALVVVATRATCVVGGVVGGRAVDRYGARPALRVDAVVRAGVMGGFVVAGLDGELGLGTVLVLAAAAGVTSPVSYAAARTLPPRLVRPDQLPRANALLAVGDQLPLLASAALVGPALTLLGIGAAFLVPATLLVVAALLVRSVRPASDGSTAAAVHEGTDAGSEGDTDGSPWRVPGVLPLVALSVAYYFTYGPFEPVLPAFARDNLGAGANGYSLLWTVFGVGAIGTLSLAPWLARQRPGMVNALGAALWGVVTLPLVLTDNLAQAAVVFFVSGAVWGPYSAVETTALQRWTPPARHGRLFGTQRALLQTASPLGAALGAAALDRTEPAVVLVASALGCTVAGLVVLGSRAARRQ